MDLAYSETHTIAMGKLLLTLAYFLASCSGDCELPSSKLENHQLLSCLNGMNVSVYSASSTFAQVFPCWTSRIYLDNGTCYLDSNVIVQSLGVTIQTIATLEVVNGNRIIARFSGLFAQMNFDYNVYGTDCKNYIVVGGCPEMLHGLCTVTMDKLLLLTLAYFLSSMLPASCSDDCDTCELPPSKFQDFNIDGLIGKPWHKYRISPPSFPERWTCWTDTFSKASDGSYSMTADLTDESTGKNIKTTGPAEVEGENILRLTFPDDPDWNFPYIIYGTDYKTYKIMGGCPKKLGEDPFIGIYYTSWTPSKDAEKAVKRILKEHGLNHYKFAKGCPEQH